MLRACFLRQSDGALSLAALRMALPHADILCPEELWWQCYKLAFCANTPCFARHSNSEWDGGADTQYVTARAARRARTRRGFCQDLHKEHVAPVN